jgi:hypothetical protein
MAIDLGPTEKGLVIKAVREMMIAIISPISCKVLKMRICNIPERMMGE